MAPTARKHRELEAREALILDHAHVLLEAKGYLGLNLDELAERIEYSKGTIYGHFETKEDLLLGVVIRLKEERAAFFRHAARFPGKTREKIAGIGIADNLFNAHRSHAFQLMQLISTASVWEKTSERRRKRIVRASQEIMEPVQAIVSEALLAGDLQSDRITPSEVLFGLFAASMGAMLIQASLCFPDGWVETARATVQRNRHHFCDGVGWRPLYAEHDFASVEAYLENEYFSELLAD